MLTRHRLAPMPTDIIALINKKKAVFTNAIAHHRERSSDKTARSIAEMEFDRWWL